MKKLLKRIVCSIITVCCLVGVTSFIACKDDNDEDDSSSIVSSSVVDSSEKKEKLVLNYSVLEMAIEEMKQLTVTNKEGTPTWTSSNSQVVSVTENGRLLALSAGKATITAKIGEIEGTCNVTVLSTGIVAGMEFPDFDDEKLELLAGSTFLINPKMTLRGEEVSYYTFSYSVVGAEGVIQIDTNGLITAVQKGSTLVTVQATHNETGNVSEQKTIEVIVK